MKHSDNQVTLYALLPEVPIPQTLQLQYHVAVQPRISYYTDGNLVIFRWAEDEARLRSRAMAFTYVPDPTSSPKYSKLERRGNRAFADGRPLMYGFPDQDPVIQKLDSLPEPFHDGKHAWFAIGQGKQLHIIEGATSRTE